MPTYVVVAMEAIAAAVGTEMVLTAGQMLMIAQGAVLVGSAALSMHQANRAKKKANDSYNASLVDRMANVSTTVGQRELVMGRVRKGGTVFARASTGATKEKFVMCVALAGHEIDAVETIFLNEVPVTLDADGYVMTEPYAMTRKFNGSKNFSGSSTVLDHTPIPDSVKVIRSDTGGSEDRPYEEIPITSLVGSTVTIGDSLGGAVSYQYYEAPSHARIRWHLGAADQAADPVLVSLFPGEWTADHRARGVSYLVCEFTYDDTAFPSGLPAVSALIRGAKLYDPRTGLTAWSENPALMCRHVLTHPQFGKRATLTAAEDARIIAAANACDTTHGYVVDGVTTTRPMFTAGYVVPYGSPPRDALDDLTQAMGGMWAYAGGEYFVRAGVYTAPVMTLTEADLAVVKRDASGQESQQPIAISTHQPRAERVNVITPRVWDAGQDYKQVALTPLTSPALIARDGAWLAREVDMPAVTYAPQALHVAGIIMRDERDPLRVTLPFKLRAYPVELFDTVALTLPRYGWTAKTFIVLGRTWTLEGLLQLTLKETAAAIYQPDAAFQAQGYADNTNLPKPWEIEPPTIIAIASGTAELVRQEDGTIVPRVRVTWAPITDQSLLQGGFVDVRYKLASAPDWQTISVPANETTVYILGAGEGDMGYIQARTRNAVASSDWTLQALHTVVGKSAAPNPVTGLTATGIPKGIRIQCVLPADVDLSHVELWRATSSTLGSATKIAEGLADHYDDLAVAPADGARYYWIRTVDTSGNLGAYVGPVSATAGTLDWSNVSGTGRPADYADVTQSILTAAGTSILMNSATLFKSTSGLGGVFMGSGGIVGKDSSGNVTFAVDGSTGAATFKGDITGGANVDIVGRAVFAGAYTFGGYSAAMFVNTSHGAAHGGVFYANGATTRFGVQGIGSGNASGVSGTTDGSGRGVTGAAAAAGGVGVRAVGAFGATALEVSGPMTIDNSTAVTNLNADMVDGKHASEFAKDYSGTGQSGIVGFNSGSATGTAVLTGKPGANSNSEWVEIKVGANTRYMLVWT